MKLLKQMSKVADECTVSRKKCTTGTERPSIYNFQLLFRVLRTNLPQIFG